MISIKSKSGVSEVLSVFSGGWYCLLGQVHVFGSQKEWVLWLVEGVVAVAMLFACLFFLSQ